MKNKNEHIQVYYVKQGIHADGKFTKTPGTSPVAAVALVWKEGDVTHEGKQVFARGIYLPQFGEQFCRASCRKYAISRARKALYAEVDRHSFDSWHGIGKRFLDCYANQFGDIGDLHSTGKAFVQLTPYEDTLIRIHYDKLNGVKAPAKASAESVIKVASRKKSTKKVAKVKELA